MQIVAFWMGERSVWLKTETKALPVVMVDDVVILFWLIEFIMINATKIGMQIRI